MPKAARRLKTSSSPTHMDESSSSLPGSLRMQEYLLALLPKGSVSYFTIRRAGKRLGLSIKCPHCTEVPPSDLSGYQKWRWLAVHIAQHKPRIVK